MQACSLRLTSGSLPSIAWTHLLRDSTTYCELGVKNMPTAMPTSHGVGHDGRDPSVEGPPSQVLVTMGSHHDCLELFSKIQERQPWEKNRIYIPELAPGIWCSVDVSVSSFIAVSKYLARRSHRDEGFTSASWLVMGKAWLQDGEERSHCVHSQESRETCGCSKPRTPA